VKPSLICAGLLPANNASAEATEELGAPPVLVHSPRPAAAAIVETAGTNIERGSIRNGGICPGIPYAGVFKRGASIAGKPVLAQTMSASEGPA
jgi:hypothetical protein